MQKAIARRAAIPGSAQRRTTYRHLWRVARNCNGGLNCVEAKAPADKAVVCAGKIATDAPIPIAFRQYAEPVTRIDPADAKLIYEHVTVFRPNSANCRWFRSC
jgi:hypothetical protein